jgi:hypothetical protein
VREVPRYYREALVVASEIGEAQLLFPCYDGLAVLYLDRGKRRRRRGTSLRPRPSASEPGLIRTPSSSCRFSRDVEPQRAMREEERHERSMVVPSRAAGRAGAGV